MAHLYRKEEHEKESDDILWREFSKGDLGALETIYDRYFYPLMHYGLSLSDNEELVKDCIQDLFTSLISRSDIPSVTYVRSYLITTLRYRLFEKQRTEKHIDSLNEESFEVVVTDDELEALFASDDDAIEIAQKLRTAYHSLRPNQRHAIYLRFIKEMSWREMTEILDISEHSCMNLVLRAINKLRALVKS